MKTFGLLYLVFSALLGVMVTVAPPGYLILSVLPFAAFFLGVWAFKRRPSRIVFTVGFLANLALALAMRFWFYVPDTNSFNETGTVIGLAAMAITVFVCFLVCALEMEAKEEQGAE